MMEHKQLSRLLIAAGGIACLGGCAVLFIYAPWMAEKLRQSNPEMGFLFWPGLGLVWIIGGFLFSALIEYWRICKNIGNDQSFCPENADRMKKISFLLFGSAILCLIPFFTFLFFRWTTGWVDFLLTGMACAAMGMLAYALHRLLKNAAALKAENDLTI